LALPIMPCRHQFWMTPCEGSAPSRLTGRAGVILDAGQPLQPFREWAQAGRANGARL